MAWLIKSESEEQVLKHLVLSQCVAIDVIGVSARLGPKTQYKPQRLTKDKSIIAVSGAGQAAGSAVELNHIHCYPVSVDDLLPGDVHAGTDEH